MSLSVFLSVSFGSGYFSLFVTHRGTTETTSRIYYVCTGGSSCPYPTVDTEAAFLANVQAALAALPNVSVLFPDNLS